MVQINLLPRQEERCSCREQIYVDTGTEKIGMNWQIRKADSQEEPVIKHRELSSMLCDNLDGWDRGRGGQEGGYIWMHVIDSRLCTAETNNIVKQLYSSKHFFS